MTDHVSAAHEHPGQEHEDGADAERMAALAQLAGGVAHEINNPLTYVLASLELALRQIQGRSAPGEPGLLDAMTLALEGVHRVRRTVRLLGVFAGAAPEHREPVDLRAVLVAVTELARYVVQPRARLVVRLDDVPPVLANEARLSEALLNTTVHAALAIPEGNPDENEVSIATWSDGDWAVAEIADTGATVAPRDLARLFDPFFARRPSHPGSLGLSFAHGAVREMGGAMRARSGRTGGCAVRIALPAYHPPAAGSGVHPSGRV